MKQNIFILLILIMVLVLPLMTSLLLDWPFIQRRVSRIILIYFFMLIEVLVLFAVLIHVLKKTDKR